MHPMHLDSYCPGCGGGEGHQSCGIIRCSQEKGVGEFCVSCKEFPCERYTAGNVYEVFIPKRNRIRDMRRMEEAGAELYAEEQKEKLRILQSFLKEYNDGRRKQFFCICVNLLNVETLQKAEELLKRKVSPEWDIREKASLAVACLRSEAEQQEIHLALYKKTKSEKQKKKD